MTAPDPDPLAFRRTLPALDEANRAFWTGGFDGRLLIARCGDCAHYVHPPLPRCPRCGRGRVVPEPVSGRGTVTSFTVNHQPWLEDMPVPLVFAAVELAEQGELYVFTNIVGLAPDAVRRGLPVRVTFTAQDDVSLPLFEPAP